MGTMGFRLTEPGSIKSGLETDSLVFATQYRCGDECHWRDELDDPDSAFYLTDCTIAWRHVESEVTCSDRNCNVTRLRPWHAEPAHDTPRADRTALGNLLGAFVNASGSLVPRTATIFEQYLFLADDAQSVVTADIALSDDTWSNASFSLHTFSERLSRLLNTYWLAGFAPGAQAFGPTGTYPPDALAVGDIMTNTTSAWAVDTRIYAVNRWWMAVVFGASAVLLGAAVVSTALRLRNPGPDILGYVGSIVRDNPYADLPHARSGMDGCDFAKADGDVRLKLADVQGGDEVGHIAVTTSKRPRRLKAGREYW